MDRLEEWHEMNAELADLSRQFADGVREKRSATHLRELNTRIVGLLKQMKEYREHFESMLKGQEKR
ncbi:hypothetical protein [Flaviaesturariibacter amylovorans]|uniref:Uncharacterized protein n=1 Tax=Flaviaesturariibacter amylovorans TaxID=1084520 RepID=A0ABP8HU09_9BACT